MKPRDVEVTIVLKDCMLPLSDLRGVRSVELFENPLEADFDDDGFLEAYNVRTTRVRPARKK